MIDYIIFYKNSAINTPAVIPLMIPVIISHAGVDCEFSFSFISPP